MININQLRFGNYVMYEQATHVVMGISESLIETRRGDCDDYAHFPSELDPIPLTEEILLKCGFSDKDYKQGYIGIDYKSGAMTFDFVLNKPGVMGNWNKCYTFSLPDYRFVNIDYLHQLQNLYFDLTREELEVKL